MANQVDPVTIKKYFRHIVDANQDFLSVSIQQRRLVEMGSRISNKMELIELEIQQLADMIHDYKALERTVKSNPQVAITPQTSLATLAQEQLREEINKLEKMYTLLSRKPSVDPTQLANIALRITSAKAKVESKQEQSPLTTN